MPHPWTTCLCGRGERCEACTPGYKEPMQAYAIKYKGDIVHDTVRTCADTCFFDFAKKMRSCRKDLQAKGHTIVKVTIKEIEE